MKRTLTLSIPFLFLPLILSSQVSEQDSLALVALYSATDGDNWLENEHWLTGPVDQWYGVTVDNNRVTVLELYNNRLIGSIPEAISELTEVYELEFSQNSLSGVIPESIGNLTKLRYLGFSSNDITGQLPASLGNCTELQDLNIAANELEGTLPASMVNCTKLRGISGHKNNFSGPFPSLLLELPLLENIVLENNAFSGELPAAINSMKQLHTFDILDNDFSGPFPRIDSLVNLNSLHIDDNAFTGNIDTIFGQHPDMYYLTMGYNQLTGSPSPENFNADRLEYAHFQYNNFDGVGDWYVFADTGILKRFYIAGNTLDFDDLEPNAHLKVANFTYEDQQPLGTRDTVSLALGESHVLSADMENPAVQYQWYFNGDSIQGATGKSYTISDFSNAKAGTYHFDARHPDFPELTLESEPTFFPGLTSGVQSLSPEAWAIYPNPASSSIQVEFPAEGQFLVEILSLEGQILRKAPMRNGQILQNINLPAGQYMLKASGEEEFGVKSLVILPE